MRSKGSGSIRKKTRPNGTVYWEGRVSAGYNGGTGERITKYVYGKTQKEVQTKINDLIHDLEHNNYVEPVKLTVEKWFLDYLNVYVKDKVKPYTYSSYSGIVKNHIIPNLGALRLQNVVGIDVQRMVNHLIEQNLNPKTIKNIINILSKGFDVAIRQGLAAHNPCDHIETPKVVHKEIRPFTEDEIPQLLLAINDDIFRNAFALCLFGGLREGECLGLSWDKVDLQTGEVIIDQQLQYSDDHKWIIVPFTKSNKSRTVFLPPIALSYLKDERLRQMQNQLRYASVWQNPGNLVFTNEAGDPISTTTFYKHFKQVASSIGRPDARVHDLRHTAATIAIASGADIKSVQSLLGHATAAFTLNVYAHTSKKMMQDTASKMQSFYESL